MAQARRFAMGGATSDTVPALLTPGEFVINKKAAESIGYNKLNKMNHADKAQGFAKGGSVGNVQGFASGGYVQRFLTGGTADAITLNAIKALGDAAGLTADEMKRSIQQSILERAHRIKADVATAINTNVIQAATLAQAKFSVARKDEAMKGGPNTEEAKAYTKDVEDTKASMIAAFSAAAGSRADDKGVQARIKAVVEESIGAAENDQKVGAAFETDSFKDLRAEFTSDVHAFNKSIEEESAATGIAADRLRTIGVSMEDIGIERTMNQMSAAVKETSAQHLKYTALLSVLGDNLGSFISGGPEAGRGSKIAGAAISGGTIAGTTAYTAIRKGMDSATEGLKEMAKMPGVIGSAAQKLLPMLSSPYTAAAAIVVAAAVGIAAAFMAAHNATKAFDKALQTKNLERALEKASEALNDFAKDNSDIGALDKARAELGSASTSAKNAIAIDVQVPDAMWVNLFDALGSANTQQASERSQILQKEGTLGYIKSTDMFGGDEYRRQKMREYAPDQAKRMLQHLVQLKKIYSKFLKQNYGMDKKLLTKYLEN